MPNSLNAAKMLCEVAESFAFCFSIFNLGSGLECLFVFLISFFFFLCFEKSCEIGDRKNTIQSKQWNKERKRGDFYHKVGGGPYRQVGRGRQGLQVWRT